jgi:hypothetical protein
MLFSRREKYPATTGHGLRPCKAESEILRRVGVELLWGRRTAALAFFSSREKYRHNGGMALADYHGVGLPGVRQGDDGPFPRHLEKADKQGKEAWGRGPGPLRGGDGLDCLGRLPRSMSQNEPNKLGALLPGMLTGLSGAWWIPNPPAGLLRAAARAGVPSRPRRGQSRPRIGPGSTRPHSDGT